MSYLGSKAQAGVWQRIIGQMPAHSFYVEPFFGSGQVYHRKRPASSSVLIDADGSVFEAFNAGNGARIRTRDRATSKMELPATRVMIGDAVAIVPNLALPADAVVYCDPPYVHSTRTSRHGYKFEMTDDQHERFLTMVQHLKCRVMISGYPSALYSARLKAWRCISYRTRTRGRTVTECLWLNFPEPTELHDWRFAGKNFRERLAMKRQAARWMTRLDEMPPVKRGYLLDLVHQRFFSR